LTRQGLQLRSASSNFENEKTALKAETIDASKGRIFMLKRMLLTAGLVSVVMLSMTTAQAQEVTLRVHHFLPAVAPVPANFITPWAEKIQSESQGRIAVEVYPAMQLGGAPPNLFDQAREGVADVVWTLPGYTPGRFRKAEVFDLPFIGADAEATSRAACPGSSGRAGPGTASRFRPASCCWRRWR
jgi:TRAP-type C4-dicarboxylate transport system substrate-binding protein